MKWLFSVHKATQRLLGSQRYHLHGGSCRHLFHASNQNAWSKSDKIQSFLYSCNYYSTSAILNASESSYRLPNNNKIENDVMKVDLEIISRETIKPSSPTPDHLRIYNFSIIDQYMYDVYTPLILFFPNTDKASVADVVAKRSKQLKASLPECLTRFYPIAGKVKDAFHIECNDEGICYTEARVNQTLEEFLDQPDDEKVRELIPESPCTEETSIGNHLIGIQVNIFNCGGIGLSTSISHKIFDGQTFYMFMKAWTAVFRGSPSTISPSFIASELFPNNPNLEGSVPSKLLAKDIKSLSTKRFVFDSTSLALLKAQPVASADDSSHPPTRMEATSAVMWKAVAQAASKVRPFSPQSPHALLPIVNLRKKASPPLPKESIGNLLDAAGALCFPTGGPMDLPTMMGVLRESIAKIDSKHIESMKGENGLETFNGILRRLNQLTDITAEGDCMFSSSLLNSRIYDLDFGWGKPMWFYVMNAGLARFLFLNETLEGGGVEAIVSLSPDEMEIVEHDSELLSYATVNPSPLQFVH